MMLTMTWNNDTVTKMLSAWEAQLVKSLDLHSKDCRFQPQAAGIFLVWAFSKPLTPVVVKNPPLLSR